MSTLDGALDDELDSMLHDELDDLADQSRGRAGSDSESAGLAADAWGRGRRRRRRRRAVVMLGSAAATVLVGLSVASAVVAVRPVPQPAAPSHTAALPDVIYPWSAQFPAVGTHGVGGPLAAVLTPSADDEKRSNGDPVGQLVGVSAVDGTYRSLDLPDSRLGARAATAFMATDPPFSLSPDGRYLAYYYGGTPSGRAPSAWLPAAVGVAVYDTTDGDVVRHPFPSALGLAPERLLWIDDTLWVRTSTLTSLQKNGFGSRLGPWYTADAMSPSVRRVAGSAVGLATGGGQQLTVVTYRGDPNSPLARVSVLGGSGGVVQEPVTTFQTPGTLDAVSVSPDLRHLVVVSAGPNAGFVTAENGTPLVQHLGLLTGTVDDHAATRLALVYGSTVNSYATYGVTGPPLGWLDDTHAVVSTDADGVTRLQSVDVTTGGRTRLMRVEERLGTVQVATDLLSRPTVPGVRPHYPPSVPDPAHWLRSAFSWLRSNPVISILLLGAGVLAIVLMGVLLPRRRRVA